MYVPRPSVCLYRKVVSPYHISLRSDKGELAYMCAIVRRTTSSFLLLDDCMAGGNGEGAQGRTTFEDICRLALLRQLEADLDEVGLVRKRTSKLTNVAD